MGFQRYGKYWSISLEHHFKYVFLKSEPPNHILQRLKIHLPHASFCFKPTHYDNTYYNTNNNLVFDLYLAV